MDQWSAQGNKITRTSPGETKSWTILQTFGEETLENGSVQHAFLAVNDAGKKVKLLLPPDAALAFYMAGG